MCCEEPRADRHVRRAPPHRCLWAALWAAELLHQPATDLFLSPKACSIGSPDVQGDRNTESSSQGSHARSLLLLPAPCRHQLASQLGAESKRHHRFQSNQRHFQVCFPSPLHLSAACEPARCGQQPACVQPVPGKVSAPGKCLRSPSCPQSAKSKAALPSLCS